MIIISVVQTFTIRYQPLLEIAKTRIFVYIWKFFVVATPSKWLISISQIIMTWSTKHSKKDSSKPYTTPLISRKNFRKKTVTTEYPARVIKNMAACNEIQKMHHRSRCQFVVDAVVMHLYY